MSIKQHFNKILHYFHTEKSAGKARERLQIIIAHERMERVKPDYLPELQEELLDVIAKYVAINKDDITLELANKNGCSILELNVILPANP